MNSYPLYGTVDTVSWLYHRFNLQLQPGPSKHLGMQVLSQALVNMNRNTDSVVLCAALRSIKLHSYLRQHIVDPCVQVTQSNAWQKLFHFQPLPPWGCSPAWPKKEAMSWQLSILFNTLTICRCHSDPLISYGCHFCWRVHALCNVKALLTNRILWLGELAEELEDAFTAEYVLDLSFASLCCSYLSERGKNIVCLACFYRWSQTEKTG